MGNNIRISEVKNFKESDGRQPFSAIVLLRSVSARTAKNGSEFLMLEFGDNTGTITTMCFEGSAIFNLLKNAPIGSGFEIDALSDFYLGRQSPKLENARMLSEDELEVVSANLAPVSPYDPVEMRKELEAFIESIGDEYLKATVKRAISDVGDVYFKSTAAVKMHHAYVYGLLEHSLKMTRVADALVQFYPLVDRDLAVAGCILHDIGKVEEYTQGLVPDRTRIGILQGHVVLGYRIVRKAGIISGLNSDLQERLEHIILSHQGELEWGAAARAATPEAIFVSSIDNFDAKMGAVEAAIANAEGAEFVEVAALRSKVLSTKAIHDKDDTSSKK